MQRQRLGQDRLAGATQIRVESLAVGLAQCAGCHDQCASLCERRLAAGLLVSLARRFERLAIALAHLLHDGERELLEIGFAAVQVIEAARDFARDLDVRRLVFADRHEAGLVDQDVGRLQKRVAEEAVGREVAVLEFFDLILVARHALEPCERRPHRQQREQLGVLGQAALDEDRRLFRVDAGGEPVDHHVVDIAFDDLAVFVMRGQRVPVGDEVEAVVFGLQPHPVLQRAVVVTEVQRAGRAHARQHASALLAGRKGFGVHRWLEGEGHDCRWRVRDR